MEQDDKPKGRPGPQEPVPAADHPAAEPPAAGASAAEPSAVEPAEPVAEEPAVEPAPEKAAAADAAAEEAAGPGEDGPRPHTAGAGASEDASEEGPADEENPADADGTSGSDTAAGSNGEGDSRRRLRAAVWPPRISRGQLVVAVLLFALGLGLAIQVRSTNDHNQLRGARQEDLVRILDELDSRQQRLQQEKTQLEQSLTQLENSSNQAKEAQEQTRKKVSELGVLAGTEPATGPGIVLTINDPQGQVKADMLLDTLQELRAAGAEAIQINDVRVVAGTYFTDGPDGGVQIDGKSVSQPFRFTVVGNPQDLTPALNIPGGVVRTLEKEQATAVITQQQKVVVDALAEPKPLQYGNPAAK
ncbi:DUF881 domain-containing protein [Kitasatospora sp. NPDC051914]|uniref:DUF881 domain-containing protein n=1 Tax=Kitasatospora sp. NPDC051914 TaxID=3154945 RepID=UPI003414CB18